MKSLPRSPSARKPTLPRAKPRVVPEAWGGAVAFFRIFISSSCMLSAIWLVCLLWQFQLFLNYFQSYLMSTHIPVGDRLANHFVCELCHVHYAAPPEKYKVRIHTFPQKSNSRKHLNQPMLTSPTVPADIWIGGWSSPWWTLVPIFRSF